MKRFFSIFMILIFTAGIFSFTFAEEENSQSMKIKKETSEDKKEPAETDKKENGSEDFEPTDSDSLRTFFVDRFRNRLSFDHEHNNNHGKGHYDDDIAFFGYGGIMFGRTMIKDMDQINDAFNRQIGLPDFEDHFDVYGGGGAGHIWIIKNLMIGGFGMGGEQEVTAKDGDIYKKAKLNYSFGGFMMEWHLPLHRRFGIGFGGFLGSSEYVYDIHQNEGNITWEDLFNNYVPGEETNHVSSMKVGAETFMYGLKADIYYKILPFIFLKIEGHYMKSKVNEGEWEFYGDSIWGSPEFVNESHMISGSLFFGF